jgi:alpha,alpha-trehalase
MMIEGLESLGGEGEVIARRLATQWLQSNYLGWLNSGGYMFEKYSATLPGARGEGGEYNPQVGFGWTNGVVLHLLNTYPYLRQPDNGTEAAVVSPGTRRSRSVRR